jgi:hypothetical protein
LPRERLRVPQCVCAPRPSRSTSLLDAPSYQLALLAPTKPALRFLIRATLRSSKPHSQQTTRSSQLQQQQQDLLQQRGGSSNGSGGRGGGSGRFSCYALGCLDERGLVKALHILPQRALGALNEPALLRRRCPSLLLLCLLLLLLRLLRHLVGVLGNGSRAVWVAGVAIHLCRRKLYLLVTNGKCYVVLRI